jgi:O-antigen ligase
MVFLNPIRSRSLEDSLRRLDLARVWARRPSRLFGLCTFTLLASMLLGGGTRGGFLSDSILELIAIPAFLVALSSLFALPRNANKRGTEWALMLCVGVAILPLMQLIPLPPWIWTRLPHREQIAGVFDLLNQDLPWLPISVAPSLTWASVLSLLPPFAVFLGVLQLGYRERRMLSLILIGLGILAAFLGLLQVAQGTSSPWRFFAVTNNSEAVGFFANRNHLAALLYSVLLFGAAWAIDLAFSVGSWTDRRSLETASIVMLTGSFLGLVVLVAAEVSTRSRAGLGLLIVALFGALTLAITDRRRSSGVTPVKLIAGATIVAFLLVVQFALYRVLDRFEDSLQGARMEFAHNTISAAEAYMPFGSGFGTFVSVYPSFEPAQDAVDDRYVNHAHDDLLEVWLEGGVVSLILMAAFVPWLFLISAKNWLSTPPNSRPIDVLLARAATIVIPLIIVHSVVDYPLRTDAMMAVFALSCAILIEPLGLAPSELKPRAVPEISDAEKRRLARLQGLKVRDNASGALEGSPQWPALAPPEETLADPSVEEGIEEDPFDVMISQGPLDLDEVSGAIEQPAKQLVDPRDEITERRLFEQGEPRQEPLRGATAAQVPIDTSRVPIDEDNSLRAPEEPLEPASPPQDDRSIEADVEPKHGGEIADMLDEFNQSSSVLVARGETGTTRESEREDSGVFTGGRTWERKMRLFRSVTLVRPLETPAPAEKKEPPRAASTMDAAPVRPIDAAPRELKVLRAVERFVQSAGLPTPPTEEVTPAAAAVMPAVPPQETAETVNSEPEMAAVEPNISEEVFPEVVIFEDVSAEVVDPVAQFDPTSLIPATESEEEEQAPGTVGPQDGTQPPRDQWGSEVEWPQQWQPGSAETVTPIQIEEELGDKEPVSIHETATTLENTVSELDEAAPTSALSEKGAEASVAREETQPQNLVPAPKPKVASKGSATIKADTPVLPKPARWGEDIEWPEEWRK